MILELVNYLHGALQSNKFFISRKSKKESTSVKNSASTSITV